MRCLINSSLRTFLIIIFIDFLFWLILFYFFLLEASGEYLCNSFLAFLKILLDLGEHECIRF